MIYSVWAIGGLILLSLGVIGEYIGKIYLETKGRPRFLLREVLEDAHGEKADWQEHPQVPDGGSA